MLYICVSCGNIDVFLLVEIEACDLFVDNDSVTAAV